MAGLAFLDERGDVNEVVSLYGTRTLVTGGGRGIGRGISLALAQAGADIALSYRSRRDAAEATASDIRGLGREAHPFQADMGDPDQIQALVDSTVAALGGIDTVVCNAGMHYRRPFLEISASEWDEVLNADLRAPFLLGQAAARQMIAQGTGGRIIMITSISADVAYPNLVHYQAAKAGLRMLMRGMALELVDHRITVNAVSPGVVSTDLSADTLNDPVQRARRVGRIPLGTPGDPADIGAAVAFLASDQTNWITGSTITVDGGQTIL
jgi:NAD(P)-dependent dehydrogenase (short-subunit alcohol dehydrogenase family)